MKIRINGITTGGVILKEEIDPVACDLETGLVRYRGPLKVQAAVSRITNAVTVDLTLSAAVSLNCSRCLKEFEVDFRKEAQLNYSVDQAETEIDLNPDIREEVILEYPIKPLCRPDCQGLCLKCGNDLNAGPCGCDTKGTKGA